MFLSRGTRGLNLASTPSKGKSNAGVLSLVQSDVYERSVELSTPSAKGRFAICCVELGCTSVRRNSQLDARRADARHCSGPPHVADVRQRGRARGRLGARRQHSHVAPSSKGREGDKARASSIARRAIDAVRVAVWSRTRNLGNAPSSSRCEDDAITARRSAPSVCRVNQFAASVSSGGFPIRYSWAFSKASRGADRARRTPIA